MAKKNETNSTVDSKIVENAKQRVAELTADILPAVQQPQRVVVDNNTSIEEEKNIEFLKEQLDVLTQTNINLETENQNIKNDYQKLYAKYKEVIETNDVSEFGNKGFEKDLIDWYVKTYDVYYIGDQISGMKYKDIPIPYFLKKIGQIFPFLKSYR